MILSMARSMFCRALLIFLSIIPNTYALTHSRVVARVNGENILEDQLLLDSPKAPRESLERQILFELAVQEAKRQGLDQNPQLAVEIKKLLYKAYLESVEQNQKHLLSPSFVELENYYAEHPLIRLRHLLLYARNPREKKQADERLSEIKKKLEEGVSFKTLVLQYSEDSSARFGGDTDFKSERDFPPTVYLEAKKLRQGGISTPITIEGTIHLIELMERKDFSDVPATYREWVRSEVRRKRETELLKKNLSALRSKADVEVLVEKFK